MRRLARHVFTILSAPSLLLAVAACVLWVRSLWVTDSHIRGGIWQPGTWNLVSARGEIGVNVARGLSWAENAASANWRRDYVLFATGDVGPRSPTQPEAGVFIRTRWVSTRHWVLAPAFATLYSAVGRRGDRATPHPQSPRGQSLPHLRLLLPAHPAARSVGRTAFSVACDKRPREYSADVHFRGGTIIAASSAESTRTMRPPTV